MDNILTQEEMIRLAYENSVKALYEAERAKSYSEIQKVWAAHSYCYRAQEQRFELEHFWAKEHDDIMYAHGAYAYVGRDLVIEYYACGNELMNEGKLKIMNELYPDEIEFKPENLGIGDLVVTLQTTPYIEIAEDNMTAQGIFYCLSGAAEIDKNGDPVANWSIAKEIVDFVRESDGWKIWHFQQSGEFGANIDKSFFEPKEIKAYNRTVPGVFPDENRIVVPPPGNGYSPKRSAKFSPELPKPYKTWDEDRSLAKPADEELAKKFRAMPRPW